jgi:hypothetical protein
VRPTRARHLLVLIAVGVVLVGSGLALAGAEPRADVQDIGRSPLVATPAEVAADRSPGPTPSAAVPPTTAAGPQVAPAPVAISLPATPEAVPLVPVGVLASGALQLPERPSVLGWFAAGAVPGDPAGTVVVAGHVDSAEFGAGPLETLLDLRVGDVVEVADAGGGVHRYSVESRTSHAKSGLPPEVFRADGPPRLALVTCGGAFDERTGEYADNVVVVAAPVP